MESLNLPYYNSTNYPLAVKEQLSNIKYTEELEAKFKYHQFLPYEFFTKNPHQRGLLIMHDMGLGKTKLAVAIADHYRQFDKKRKVIVLLSKSLEGNFRNTILDYTKQDTEYIDANYKFVSLNASNMYKQITNVDKRKEEIEYENKLGDFMDDIKRTNSLDNSLLIIDEAHNLFNSITNGAKNATNLYDLIMNAKNLKLIFLTGTPIINDPFELVPCFNMLKGYINISDVILGRDTSKNTNNTTLFSEDIEEFNLYFIDHKTKSIKNKEKFINRIYGLNSYYGDLYLPSSNDKPGFPKKLNTIIEKVPMSQTQYSRYAIARNMEQEETKKGYRSKDTRFSSSTGGSSTYRVKSRQISNYCIPEYALGPIRGQKSREKFVQKITAEDLINTDKFSPKMGKILKNIGRHSNTPGMVYSQFVSGEGLAIFARILEANGYKNISDNKITDDSYEVEILDIKKDILKDKNLKKFAILSGDISPEERQLIITQFNTKENADGSIIALLLLSGAVAEGIDLKRIRHVHIMESFWNYARIKQVETRAIRYLSHVDLPPEQQNVQTYIYLSDYPIAFPKDKIKEPTTDVDLYNKSLDNMQIIQTFITAMAESSIDCSLHQAKFTDEVKKKIHCKLCAPDNQMLFHPLLTKDMTLPSNCKPYAEKKITANEIILDDTGEKFYYRKSTDNVIKLYHFNKKINGYTELPRNHPYYGVLMDKIISL